MGGVSKGSVNAPSSGDGYSATYTAGSSVGSVQVRETGTQQEVIVQRSTANEVYVEVNSMGRAGYQEFVLSKDAFDANGNLTSDAVEQYYQYRFTTPRFSNMWRQGALV